MPAGRQQRRLAAILSADVVGYTRMVGADETATLESVKAAIDGDFTSRARAHGGRVVKTMGDGVLAEFPSSVEALLCAIEFQEAMAKGSAAQAAPPLAFRVGIDVGDVVRRNGDVFGDVVNLAARLQAMAPPGGVCVTERVREDARGRVKAAFEDAGEQRLKNVERLVRVFRVRLGAAAPDRLAFPLPERPSVAVLPFDNMSGDPSQEYIADSVTEDIISALSRWRWFFVIARNSTFIYKGRAVDVAQVGRDLGVRYVLEGSVRKIGDRIRVVAQLIDAATGAHIWADTLDRDISDWFALYDEITERIVGAVEPAMLHNESERVAKGAVTDLTAFDHFLRGLWRLNQLTQDSFVSAEEHFRAAVGASPGLSLAHTGLARLLYGKVVQGWSDDAERDLVDAEAAARTAIAIDSRDAWAHFALSGALLYLGRHQDALEEAERALALNPNFAFAHFRCGQVLIYMGRPGEAIAPIERSIRHNPYDPQIAAMQTTLALAHYHAGGYEAAIAHASNAAHRNEPRAIAVLAASLARLGRLEEARAAFTVEAQERARALMGRRLIPYARAEQLQELVEGLFLAGLAAPLPRDFDPNLPDR